MAVLSSRPAPWTSGELFLFKALIELGAEPAMSERNPCSGLGGLKLLPYEVRAAIGIDIRESAHGFRYLQQALTFCSL